MNSNHLEELLFEFFDWKDYLVKKNIFVGKREKGGYEMELDIVAYNPHNKHLVHVETSLDALSWSKREERYKKKFEVGRKYIFNEVFTWLDNKITINEIIVAVASTSNGFLNDIRIISVDDCMSEIINEIKSLGKASKNAVPEQYPLLRTIQFCYNGYHKIPEVRSEVQNCLTIASSR